MWPRSPWAQAALSSSHSPVLGREGGPPGTRGKRGGSGGPGRLASDVTQKDLTLPSAQRAPGVYHLPLLCVPIIPGVWAGKVEGLPGARGRFLVQGRQTAQEPKSGQAEFGVVKLARPAAAGANCGWGQCEGDVWPHLFRGCLVSGLAWPTPSRERVSHVRAGGRASEQERSSGWAWGWRGDGRGRAVGGDGQRARLAVLTDRPDLHLGELE